MSATILFFSPNWFRQKNLAAALKLQRSEASLESIYEFAGELPEKQDAIVIDLLDADSVYGIWLVNAVRRERPDTIIVTWGGKGYEPGLSQCRVASILDQDEIPTQVARMTLAAIAAQSRPD